MKRNRSAKFETPGSKEVPNSKSPFPSSLLALVSCGILIIALATGCSKPRVEDSGPYARTHFERASFFVATNGNDAWSGKLASPNRRKTDGPLATIAKALRAIRETRLRSGTRHADIFIRGGFYFLNEPLVISPEDSDIVLSAYRNEKPVISGGRRIGGWREFAEGKLWRADVPEAREGKWFFREFWVNGKRATRTRHPNHGYFSVAEGLDTTPDWTKGQTRFRFREGDLNSRMASASAEVVVMDRWVESRLPILSVDEKERTVTFGKRSVFQLAAGDLYYLENASGTLDEPGEWFFDRTTGTVYYEPLQGETIDKIDAIAPVLSQVVRVEGQPAARQLVERVVFKGLTFSHTEWCFPKGFESAKNKPSVSPETTAEVGGFAQAAIGVPGAVWGEGAHECAFENCTFENLGDYGLELGRGCMSNRIVECEFGDLGAGGIKIGETAVRQDESEQSGFNEIANCDIHDGGKMFPSAIGIWMGQSPNNRITHNLIHDFYYTGISIGWTWGYGPSLATNNLIAFNHVHHIGVKSDGDGPILSDMGGIYTLGKQPGTKILNNLWHDIAGLRYGGWGIYFDEGSSGILAQDNVVYRTTHGGFHQHYGETNRVWNNIFAFGRDQQLQRTRNEPHTSFSFQTNIIYFDSGTLLSGDWSGTNFQMDWNIYFDGRPDAKAIVFGNNFFEQWKTSGHDLNSVLSNPGFVAPAKYDFRLRDTSPALPMRFQQIDLGRVGIQGRRG